MKWLFWLAFAATFAGLATARADLHVQLEGCSESTTVEQLERALSLELPVQRSQEPAQLRASFDCAMPTQVNVCVLDEAMRCLSETSVSLAGVPAHAQSRVLALLWVELLRTLSVSGDDAVESVPEPSPVLIAPVQALPPVEPPVAQPLPRIDTGASATTHLAVRRPLFGRTSAGWLELRAGATLTMFLSPGSPLLGAHGALRFGTISLGALYLQTPTRATPLGYVDSRITAGSADLTVGCLSHGTLQLCALLEGQLGRAQASGQALHDVSTARVIRSAHAAGAFALTTRYGGQWLALELAARAGYAHGPTARLAGRELQSLQGPFVGLSLEAALQP